jgi:hypothetical protein
MTIKRFTVFTWDRILCYLGGPVACVIAGFFSVRYNYFVRHSGMPAAPWIALTGAFLAFTCIAYEYFAMRVEFKQTITSYTVQGVGIIYNEIKSRLVTEGINTEAFEITVSDLIGQTVKFWQDKYPAEAQQIADYPNGGFAFFIPYKMETHHTNPLTGQTIKLFAVGLTLGKSMTCSWLPEHSYTQVLNEIRHEAGHMCLNGAGFDPYDGDLQHKIMADAGFDF